MYFIKIEIISKKLIIMRNKVLGLLTVLVLFIGSCVVDPGVTDTCIAENTGDLTIVNATSGVDGVGLEIYINGIFTGATISPGGQHYEGALGVDIYEVEGRASSGTVQFLKSVSLLQCDDLFVELGN
ncbi:MAG: hypothetical protein ACI97N_001788 [Cognaticolwellia sp.]